MRLSKQLAAAMQGALGPTQALGHSRLICYSPSKQLAAAMQVASATGDSVHSISSQRGAQCIAFSSARLASHAEPHAWMPPSCSLAIHLPPSGPLATFLNPH